MNDIVVGLTYDLREAYLKMGYSEEETAEFDKIDTIEAIEEVLQSLGYKTQRIGNVRDLVSALHEGQRWDLVFNIAEGLYGSGREAQVPALLDAYQIPYVFSGPLVMTLTLDKGMTKRVIRDAGLPTADFSVVSHVTELGELDMEYPLFVKPLAEGTGKGITARSVIRDKQELFHTGAELLRQYHQPLLVETYLSGREFTVGITGTGSASRAVGVMEILLSANAEQGLYSYENKEDYLNRVNYARAEEDIEEACRVLALDIYQLLGCEDAGRVDLRMDSSGNLNFLEINPLAGLHPVHSDLPILCRLSGISYHELISRIMESAMLKLKIRS